MGNTVTACACASAGGELIHLTNKRNNGLLDRETEGGGGARHSSEPTVLAGSPFSQGYRSLSGIQDYDRKIEK